MQQQDNPDEAGTQGQPNAGIDFAAMPGMAIKVITNPVGFYQQMSKSGGFVEPLVFMVVLALVAGLLQAVLPLLGLSLAGAMAMGFVAIILVPIFTVIFGFIGAAIAFIIWKIMGSQENFETAFRCMAFTAAVAPVTAVLGAIPYVGTAAGVLWPMALLAIASIHVHQRSAGASWGVFGIIGLLFAFISLSMETAGRKMTGEMEGWQQQMDEKYGNPEDMAPEEAGKAMGEFLKGLQQGSE